MPFFRKSPLSSRLSEADSPPIPADQLRADMEALEADLAESQRNLAEVEERMRAAEARAIAAVHAGDDPVARTCLLEHEAYSEKAAAIAADVKVMRAILDECHEFINRPI